jgi:succinate dehydrogenase / fumarate reductase cytochrome b subunit
MAQVHRVPKARGARVTPEAPSNFLTRHHFWLRRLHSLSGVLPVGIFMVFHLYTNSQVLSGRSAYNSLAGGLEMLPLLWVLEWLGIFLPLIYHAAYGLVISSHFFSGYNGVHYGYARNRFFVLQRVTGMIALVFIAYHVWTLRIVRQAGAPPTFGGVAAALHNPWVVALYLVGVVATCYHFANGLWSFAVTWGIAAGPRAQRVWARVTWIVFLALASLAVAIVVRLITG